MALDLKDKSIIVTAITFYSAALSLLYPLGYWRRFKINPFEFAGISEIIYSGIFFAIAVGTVFLLVLGYIDIAPKSHSKPTGRVTIVGTILGCTVIALMITAIYFISKPLCLLIMGALIIVMPILSQIGRIQIVKSLSKTDSNIVVKLSMMIAMPAFIFFVGYSNAADISEGTSFHYIEKKYLPKIISDLVEEDKIKYLGKLDDHIFLLSMSGGKIMVAKENDIRPLVLEYQSNQQMKAQTVP